MSNSFSNWIQAESMVSFRGRTSANEAGQKFAEWASLFPDGIFVKAVIIYADESGTHDRTGRQEGSAYPIIAGFAAPPSEWSKFCVDWKTVLNSYGVPYFHFWEWAAASAAVRFNRPETPALRKNPYYGWDIKRLDKFLYTLAEIAGAGNKVPIAGAIRTEAFNRIKADLEKSNPENIQIGEDPFKFSIGEFFKVYHRETWIRWGNFNAPVTFFFDQSEDSKWKSAILEAYSTVAKADTRFSGISFVDKKQMPHLPLQAADMLAYRIRQAADRLNDGSYDVSKLDKILLQGLLRSVANASPELSELLRRKNP